MVDGILYVNIDTFHSIHNVSFFYFRIGDEFPLDDFLDDLNAFDDSFDDIDGFFGS